MTISDKLQKTSQVLKKNKILKPELESQSILSIALNKDRSFLFSHNDYKLSKQELNKINHIIKKRINHYPLAYITKKQDFYKYSFKVNKNTLIPRPESELIVEEVIGYAKNKENPISIIDIGTGSACLITSIYKELVNKKNIGFYGLDICEKALRVARINAKDNGASKDIKFYQSDLLNTIKNKGDIINKELTILANLPYLTKKEIKESSSIKEEPFKALYGGDNGLKYYIKLIKDLVKIKKHNKVLVYMEISPWQKTILYSEIKKIVKSKHQITTLKDLAKKDRLVFLTIE